ncbi:MAG: hypothetical protein JW716_05020 [Candidatus Aenigmarchaeota archaeon]|nr:hypothetical protein [Candidatus Aenigmarchaeota archaeon]
MFNNMKNSVGHKKMKGMQVIEVIFILIIMIIVTVVLVNMFTEMMGGGKQSLSGQLNDIQEYNQGREAMRKCNDLCNDFKMTGDDSDAINYCIQAVAVDVSGDGVIKDIDKGSFALIALPPGQDEVCEEHIYCPMIGGSECKYGSRSLTMDNCEATLCRYYQKNSLTAEQAAMKVDQLWDLGECDLAGSNWAGWIGPMCGTNITITGALGGEAPNNGGGNNGGSNPPPAGGSGVCDTFCNGLIYEGQTYTLAYRSNCMTGDDQSPDYSSCLWAPLLDTSYQYINAVIYYDGDNKQNPCTEGSFCCCAFE